MNDDLSASSPDSGYTGMTDVAANIASLDIAAEIIRARIGVQAVEPAAAGLATVHERADLGYNHVITAIVGGTGSGKSSVFNALAEVDFAEVGATRPSTSRPSACVWGAGADPLLTWLGVDYDRRLRRDSALDDHIAAFRGLILLDLPDLDSHVDAHRTVVDTIIPKVDVLVWILDPQKYADLTVHIGYLQDLTELGGSIIVAFNQVDTVARGDVPILVEDVKRLLAGDGLDMVPVIPVSAKTGENVSTLRDEIIRLLHDPATTAARHRVDVRDVANQLGKAAAVSGGAPGHDDGQWLDEAQQAVVEEFCGAMGILAAVNDLAAKGEPASPCVPIQPERVQQAREQWVLAAEKHLPSAWTQAVARALASTANIATRLGEVGDSLVVPPRAGGLRRVFAGSKLASARAQEFLAAAHDAVSKVVAITMTEPSRAVVEDRATVSDVVRRLG